MSFKNIRKKHVLNTGTLSEAIFGTTTLPKTGSKDEFEVKAVFLLEQRYPGSALVIAYRHGFMDGEPKSFRECARLLNRSIEPTRRRYFKGLRVLRHPSLNKYLKPMLAEELDL